jgi:hypothetical protein
VHEKLARWKDWSSDVQKLAVWIEEMGWMDGLRNERGRSSNGNSMSFGCWVGWELIDVGSLDVGRKFMNKRLCSGASHNYAFSYFHASAVFRHDIIIASSFYEFEKLI